MSATADNSDLIASAEERTDTILPTTLTVSYFEGTARPADEDAPDIPYDLLSVFAVAQKLGVDLLPLRWTGARARLGIGGQSSIDQEMIHFPLSYAFKRVRENRQDSAKERDILQTIITEISILGHPSIREHSNIIRLEGLCCDIQTDENIWPVLIFQKTGVGDLYTFAHSAKGNNLCMAKKLHLCADIAVAIRDIHSKGVIHGDIKPENILIFEDQPDIYIAKVADLGGPRYRGGKNNLVEIPKSSPWNAPEHHHRAFRLSEAMKTDVYSFGLLCLWFLFLMPLFMSETSSPDECLTQFYNARKDVLFLTQLLEKWKWENRLPELVYRLLHQTRLKNQMKNTLSQFFSLALTYDPCDRTRDFNLLLHSLDPERALAQPIESEYIELPPQWENFPVTTSLPQLYIADFRLRSYVTTCLTRRAATPTINTFCDTALENTAFQLAFCYEIGLGVKKDRRIAQRYLESSGKAKEEVQVYLDLVSQEPDSPRILGQLFEQMFSQLHINQIDYSHHYENQELLDRAAKYYKREITDLEDAFKDTHWLVRLLKTALASILCRRDQAQLKEAEELEVQVLETSQRIFGQEHTSVWASMIKLAYIYASQERWDKAEELTMPLMTRYQKTLGQGHPQTLSFMSDLIVSYVHQRRWTEAEDLLLHMIKIKQTVLGQQHPELVNGMALLECVYQNQGRFTEAEILRQQWVEIARTLPWDDLAPSSNRF